MEDIINKKGLNINKYYKTIKNRSDICGYLVHLTKPSENVLKKINRLYADESEKIELINMSAVDNLILILKMECVFGSGRDGFIVGGSNKTAACFQEVPFKNVKETVDMAFEDYYSNRNGKLRYSGVGIAFNKFTVYEKGGRPVIYEKTEVAKQLLNYNEDEYWRIVNFELQLYEPIKYDIDPADVNWEAYPEEEYDNDEDKSQTWIIDFTYEREWRVPNEFRFSINEDVSKKKDMYLIFPNRGIYNYFIEEISKKYREENKLWEQTKEENIYKPDKLENIKKYGIEYYYDRYDDIYYIPLDALYTEEFYYNLQVAQEIDKIYIDPDIFDKNCKSNLGIKIIILDEQ